MLWNSGNSDEKDDEHDYEYYNENADETSCFATELREFSLFHIDDAYDVDNDDDDNDIEDDNEDDKH